MGLLVDLIRIDDDDLARVITAACEQELLTLVVKDRCVRQEINNNQKYCKLDVISTDSTWCHTVIKQDGRLVFHQEDENFAWKTEKAIVNLIQFCDSRHEVDMRKSVAFALFDQACVVDSDEDAQAKMTQCRNASTKCPDLIELREGKRLKGNGVSNGLNKGKQSTTVNRIVIGESDHSKLRDMQLQKIADIKKAMEDWDEHRKASDEAATSFDEWSRDHYIVKKTKLDHELYNAKQEYDEIQNQEEASAGQANGIATGHIPPKLAFMSPYPGSSFAFDFNVQGLADIRNLGLEPGYGTKEGDYVLRFQLHWKANRQPVLREVLDRRPTPVIVIDDDQ